MLTRNATKPNQGDRFKPLRDHLLQVKSQLSCSAAATLVIHNDAAQGEFYAGDYDCESELLPVTPASRFNVASVRKSYIGLAIGLALHQGRIASPDDPIADYLSDLNRNIVGGTTIRHLLTHTHGLKSNHARMFPPGTGWFYNNVGINMLIRLVLLVFEAPLSEVMRQYVFEPYGFAETGWCKHRSKDTVWIGEAYAGEQGGEANLFASARELAYWGYLHLNRGFIGGKRTVPEEAFALATTVQSPRDLDEELPRNGFAWWVQDRPRPDSQLGSTLPVGSYQILGKTGCAVLVVPDRQLVAVRMLNHVGENPRGYDYLEDIRAFGDIALACAGD